MKRGQAEIIGLVVVVLLLVFALIFFVKIKGSDDENESRLIRSNLRANSALNALMKVHIENDDEKRQMKDLISEGCTDNDSCERVKEKLEYYLNDPKVGIFNEEKYHLIVSEGGKYLISVGKYCASGINASPFIVGTRKVDLTICT